MAWEETKRQGQVIMTGDKPIDAMALALQKITQSYIERFDRKPALAEILYALELVIMAAPSSYLSEPEAIGAQNIFVEKS